MSTKEIVNLIIAAALGWIGATIWFKLHPPPDKKPE